MLRLQCNVQDNTVVTQATLVMLCRKTIGTGQEAVLSLCDHTSQATADCKALRLATDLFERICNILCQQGCFLVVLLAASGIPELAPGREAHLLTPLGNPGAAGT